MKASILRVIQEGKYFNLFIETADFHIIQAVLFNMRPVLFFLLTKSTPDFRHFKHLIVASY